MKAIIVSDLHIGSRYCLREDFMQFLESIPQDHEFILNGDIIDNPYGKLSAVDRKLLDGFGEMSLRQKVVWIRGNHDNGYVPDNLGEIKIKQHYALQKKLFVTHGDFFDEVMPQSRAFIRTFKWLHDLRIKLGARPVHVAQYAKKWRRFYAYLRKNVMINAVHYARENGFSAVTCGHTHYAEEQFINGIKYLNTGAWTERPSFYVRVTADEIVLEKATTFIEKQKSSRIKPILKSDTHHSDPARPVPFSNKRS
jgi:UDP-2,3-diacylglucosamine pyrophosphatase LpxH